MSEKAGYITLEDGRPIDMDSLQKVLENIEKTGVRGMDMSELPAIFSTDIHECQVALKITPTVWNTQARNPNSRLKDVGLALAIRFFLRHPERWPVAYRKEPNIDLIRAHYRSLSVPPNDGMASMLVGRGKHSAYRWARTKPTHDHIQINLLRLEEMAVLLQNEETASEGSDAFDEYMADVYTEARIRGVDFARANSWKSIKEKEGD